jgi:hypothetical protein
MGWIIAQIAAVAQLDTFNKPLKAQENLSPTTRQGKMADYFYRVAKS